MKLTLALVATLAAATAAQAQTTTVRYADLDLDSQAGRAELERRIDGAIHRVCPEGTRIDGRILDFEARARCAADVRAQVAERLHH